MKITIKNSNQEIECKRISLVGGTSDFILTNDCGMYLHASKNCVITVTFIPSSKGAKSASVLIDLASPVRHASIGLSGTGN